MQIVGRHSLLRDLNYRAVFEHLATQGPLSRADTARSLELSPASVSRLVDGLLGAGLIAEGERVASRAGRRQTLLDVNPAAAVVAGLSIRSRSVRLLLTDLKGRPLAQAREDRRDETPDALIAQVRDLVLARRDEHAPGTPIGAVVVGISGAWDPNANRVHAAPNLAVLEGTDALSRLRGALAPHVVGDTVTIDNDINYAALGEHAHGAARGTDDFFYLSLGSGVGGAAVVDGRLHRGASGFAGEIGFLPLRVDGEPRSLESLVGRRALEGYAEEAGIGRTGSGFFEQLESSHPAAEAIAERVGRYLAVGLASVVVTLDPKLVVLGGGIGRYSDRWIASIRQRMARFVPVVPELRSTTLGRDASLRGAAAHGLTLARQALVSAELVP